jgi:hypothetical protein
MSRNNKVNRDHYVQRGRLTPDEAARELTKMRQVGSPHKWQPSKKNDLPRFESKNPAGGTETTEDKGSEEETSPDVASRPAARVAKGGAKPAVNSKTQASKPAVTRSATAKKSGKAKTATSAKSAGKSKAGKPKRKAVLARNVGGGGATPAAAAKRRKS